MILKKALFLLLLFLINGFGLGIVGLTFILASNANGEGAPIESGTTSFLKNLLSIAVVSVVFSLLTIVVTLFFRNKVDYKIPSQKMVFLLQFSFLIIVWVLIFLFIYWRFYS